MKIDMNLVRASKRECFHYFFLSIFSSFLGVSFSLFFQVSEIISSFYCALAAYHLGFGLRAIICERFHSEARMKVLSDHALRDVLLTIDAERISKGLKPLSEFMADDIP